MRWLLGFVVVYLLSGVFIIRSEEVGVVRLFGRVWQERVPPGLHYRPPFPFSRLNKIKVRQIRRVTIGMQAADALMGRQSNPALAQFLTGDQNIIIVRAVAQFTIRDPVSFLFTAADAEGIVQRVVETMLAEEVACTSVDEVMTTGKIALQNRVRKKAQLLLDDRHHLGVALVAVALERVAPPDPVKDAFEAVTQARQTRQQRVLEAQTYANTVLPQARGETQRIINEAIAYRARRIAEAKGNADRFLALWAQYRKAKEVTAARLYLEAVEEILPRLKKVIVDAESGQLDVGMVRRQP
jgi:membrane protease subunit HflK